MALPALHISLGVYLKFFNLLEKHCQILDLKIAANENMSSGEEVEEKLINAYNSINDFDEKIEEYEATIELIQEAMAIELSKENSTEDEIIAIYQPRIDHFVEKIKIKVKNN